MHKNCPKCGVTWESNLSLPADLMKTGHYKLIEDAEKAAAMYGWTKENDKRFGANHHGIEYAGVYDGVLHWKCEVCNVLWHRFSNKEVNDNKKEI